MLSIEWFLYVTPLAPMLRNRQGRGGGMVRVMSSMCLFGNICFMGNDRSPTYMNLYPLQLRI